MSEPSAVREREPTRSRSRSRRALLVLLAAVATGLAAYVLAGNSSEVVTAGDVLSGIHPGWVVLAVAAEAASYLANGAAIRLLLAAHSRIRLWWFAGITLSGQALANLLPAGSVPAWAFSYRQLRRLRIAPEVAAWALLITGALSTATLAVLAVVGAEVAPEGAGIPGLRTTALVVLGVLAVVAVLAHRLRTTPLVAAAWLRLRRLLHRRNGGQRSLRERLTAVEASRARLAAAAWWAGVAWLADAAALAAAFPAIGADVPLSGLVLAYTAGQLAAQLPITPGGLGVVEGSLTLALVTFGGAEQTTLAAVLVYRLISYWGVLPLGLLSYLGLRRHPAAAAVAA